MLIFDCETDGLYFEATKLHCLAIYDTLTDTVHLFDPANRPIEEGLRMLMAAPKIAGHNVIGFDLPVIKKLYPWFDFRGEAIDTLVITRVAFPEIGASDFGRFRAGILPGHLIGRHSLEAWGYRLQCFKGGYGKQENAWEVWTPEMSKYCIQDVRVTWTLYQKLKSKPLDSVCFHLEHKVAEVISRQTIHGFRFDIEAAEKLTADLGVRRAELREQLSQTFKPWFSEGKEFIPKKDNKRMGYVAGCAMTKLIYNEFNPNSRVHIAFVLKKYFGWEPEAVTDKTGEAKIDDEILDALPWPEAKLIAEYMMIQKRLGQIAEGKKAWLKFYREDTKSIHGGVNTNGAVTGRMTHSDPNIAQVPSVDAPWGTRCRACFTVRPGYKQVGCDASGLEARCLAHFMARYDDGAYIDIVINGNKEEGTDVHGRNMKALGLEKPKAKRWFYAWCYGAGDDLLGQIAGGDKKLGAKLRRKFIKAFPAIGKLIEAVQQRTHIRGLDGRIVPVRAKHSALNTLLQGAGAIIMKQALVFCDERLRAEGIDFEFVANIHDEFQMEVREDQAERAGEIARQAIIDAGEFFNFRCPLDAEFKIGNNWAETH